MRVSPREYQMNHAHNARILDLGFGRSGQGRRLIVIRFIVKLTAICFDVARNAVVLCGTCRRLLSNVCFDLVFSDETYSTFLDRFERHLKMW